VATYPALFAELIRRGWSDADLRKLAGLNLIRTLREAETVAARLQTTRKPSTATIEQLDGRTAPKCANCWYASLGYRTVGVIPGFCRDTADAARLDATTIMYKALALLPAR
jgi:hypothetical protein